MPRCILTPTSVLVLSALLGAQVTTATWSERAKPPAYPHSNGTKGQAGMGYDQARDRTVLYIGSTNPQTWEYDGFAWTQIQGTYPRLSRPTLMYDNVAKQVIMCGGQSIYAWDGSDWSLVPSTNQPSQASNSSLAFDSKRGVLVRFGGDRGGRTLAETWEFSGGKWVQKTNGGPPDRRYASMVFDEARGEVLLFGGHGIRPSNDDYFADTWVWNGTYWYQHFGIAGPLGRSDGALVYDPGRKVSILFGGTATDRGGFRTAVWEWNGMAWTQLVQPTLLLRAGKGSFDRRRGVGIFIGDLDGKLDFRCLEYLNRSGVAASYRSLGTGCQGSAGVPRFDAGTDTPKIGEVFAAKVSGIPAGPLTRVLGLVGRSGSSWGTIPLPLDLGILGMKNCSLLVSIDLPMIPINHTAGLATWDMPIPNSAALAGSRFFAQALVLDPGVNAFGAVVSNGMECLLGY